MKRKRPVFRQGRRCRDQKEAAFPSGFSSKAATAVTAAWGAAAALRRGQGNAYPTSGGNSVSFGVPMRRDSCTSQGLQPWLISTSDCTDMYM